MKEIIKKSPFDLALDDLLANPDFSETFYFNERPYSCLVSSVDEKNSLTEYGLDEGVSFYLTTKAIKLKKNDRITYQEIVYKVVYTTFSGHCYKVFLASLSSKG